MTTQFPEMTGDEQIIGFAVDRRERVIAELDETIERRRSIAERTGDEDDIALLNHTLRGREMLLAITDAEWWRTYGVLGADRLLVDVAGTVVRPNY